MSSDAALVFLKWLCEELVNALLRPVWTRAALACDRGGERLQRIYELRFERLVMHCNCWPCRVEWGGNSSLFITSQPPEDDADDYWRREEEFA